MMEQPSLLEWVPKGETYRPELDRERLKGQILRVLDALSTGRVFTLRQLADAAECPEASASARFRDLRALNYPVRDKRKEGAPGTWLYWMDVR